MDGRRSEARVGARAGTETGPKSRLREPKIAELGLLEISSLYAITPLRTKGLSDSSKAPEPYRGFL